MFNFGEFIEPSSIFSYLCGLLQANDSTNMKKIIALLFAVVTAFAFSSFGKDDEKKDDSYSATVITLDATDICADSACLNAKITTEIS